jgi:hypothetical protein
LTDWGGNEEEASDGYRISTAQPVTIVAVFAVAASLASVSSSDVQPISIATGDHAIDALVSDIAAGRRAQAIVRIAYVTSTGEKRLVRTPTQFVDRLLKCTPLAGSVKPIYGQMTQVTWACGGIKYRAVFEFNDTKPYIVVML